MKNAKGQWKDKKEGCEVAGGRGEGKKTRYEIAAGIWAQRGDALLPTPPRRINAKCRIHTGIGNAGKFATRMSYRYIGDAGAEFIRATRASKVCGCSGTDMAGANCVPKL